MILIAPTSDDVASRAKQIAFGQRIVNNVFRGLVAEVIVEFALRENWRRPGYDWAPHDLESGPWRLEVKQSAVCQTWPAPRIRRPPKFDIAPRKGYYDEEGVWYANVGRAAHLYVFALHPISGEFADQRDSDQWVFLVVPTCRLPSGQQSIGWRQVERLASLAPCRWQGLADAVSACKNAIAS